MTLAWTVGVAATGTTLVVWTTGALVATEMAATLVVWTIGTVVVTTGATGAETVADTATTGVVLTSVNSVVGCSCTVVVGIIAGVDAEALT